MRGLLGLSVVMPMLSWAHDPITTRLTWTQEISRIVNKRCATCHSAGSSIPLDTYENARPWAKAMKDEVLNRRMPPWGAVKGFGDFANDPSLTQSEMLAVAEWVEGGAPEGDPQYLAKVEPVRSTKQAVLPKHRRVKSIPRATTTLLGIRPLQSVDEAKVVAHLPDGSVIPLVWLRGYQEKWNRVFVYREPVSFPIGTHVESTPPIRMEFLVR